MQRPRLGPLGAPAAIVGAWILTRAVFLLPGLETIDRAPIDVAQGPAAPPKTPTFARRPVAEGVEKHAVVTERSIPAKARSATAQVSQRRQVSSPQTEFTDTPYIEAPRRTYASIVVGSARSTGAPYRPLTGSAWALFNGTGGTIGAPSLGGSQMGVRLFLQGARAPVGLTARFSRALGRSRDTEISAGYALRVHGLGLLVERRQRLDVQDGAFVATGYGGAYDIHLPADFRFDGFAQAGVAGLRSHRWFADGQARVTRRSTVSDGISIGGGAGAWAGAQRSASRVEVGPLVEARLRSGSVGLRLASEYRYRVTGRASPRSGFAMTMGLDF